MLVDFPPCCWAQANFRGFRVRQAYKTYRLGGEISELLYSPATYGFDLSAHMVKPRARAAPMLCVLRNTLWMLGGQVEISHADIVLGEQLAAEWLPGRSDTPLHPPQSLLSPSLCRRPLVFGPSAA